MSKMISWQMTGVGEPLKRQEAEIPTPGAGEVLVEVAGCGVCHTDLGFYYDGVRTKSPPPLTLGHEISGMVTQAGEGMEHLQGKAVIIPAVMPCGECSLCQSGMGAICQVQKMPGNDIQGGFASHIVVPGRDLCLVEVAGPGQPVGQSGVTLAELSVIADALTTPYQAIELAGMREGDVAIFVGAGGVGGFGVQIAKALGAHVVAIDINPQRLEMLAPYCALQLNAKEHNPKEIRKAIRAWVKEEGLSPFEWKIFETSGTKPGQELAYGLLTHGAHLAIVGFTMEKPALRLSNLMAFHARAQGNWGCLPEHYPPVLKLVEEGKVQLGPFVQTFPLDQIQEVFGQVHEHKVNIRPILVP